MNIKFIKQIILGLIFFVATIAFAFIGRPAYATPYGQCTYGSHLYNGQCVSSNSGGGSSGGGGGGGSTTTASTCSSQPPGSAPNLYQINTTGTTATLYFAPSDHPYDNYYVSFGDGTNDSGYGAGFQLSQTTGALRYDVFKLKPNSRYTFKVRAGNGCMPGPWSSTMSIKTGVKNAKVTSKYYPARQAYFTKSIWARVNGIWTKILKLFPR